MLETPKGDGVICDVISTVISRVLVDFGVDAATGLVDRTGVLETAGAELIAVVA